MWPMQATPGYTEETPTWQENDSDPDKRGLGRDRRHGDGRKLLSGTGSSRSAWTSSSNWASGLGFAPDGAQFDPGSVYAGFRLDQFNSRRHWQRYHRFFFQSFSSLEANPPISALRESVLSTASYAGDRYFERGQRPEHAEHRIGPAGSRSGWPGKRAHQRDCHNSTPRFNPSRRDADAGNPRGSAAVGSKPTLAVGRHQPVIDGKNQRASPLPPPPGNCWSPTVRASS